MKPKPFESLNHFTVPVAMFDSNSLFYCEASRASRAGTIFEGGID